MTEQKKSSTSAPSNPPKGTVNVPQVETADADVDPNTVLGAQQNYAEGENPSDKGISGTYPAGDERLVRKADGQVWPADNRDAFTRAVRARRARRRQGEPSDGGR
jgi:hypothetical protein